MKAICQGAEFSDAINKVARAISAKKTHPILEGILVSAKDDVITLTGTDGELVIQKNIKADVLDEGQVVVPGKITDIVKSVPTSVVELNVVENNVMGINFDRSEYELNCMDAEDYPAINKIKESRKVNLTGKEIKKLVSSVKHAVAFNDSRQMFNGILLEFNGGVITSVALDGFRMSFFRMENESTANYEFSAIVPPRSLEELIKLIDNDDDTYSLIFGEGQMMVQSGDFLLITRLILGDYAKYNGIVPTGFTTEITVNIKNFKDAISRVSVIAKNEKTNSIKFNIEGKSLNLIAQSESVGKGNENLEIKKEGKDVDITFNVKYILDCLNSIDDDYVRISIKNSASASVFLPLNTDKHVNLILPIRSLY